VRLDLAQESSAEETGRYSPWVSRLLSELEHEVIVAHTPHSWGDGWHSESVHSHSQQVQALSGAPWGRAAQQASHDFKNEFARFIFRRRLRFQCDRSSGSLLITSRRLLLLT
jgi:hypothetical protein